ncbi:MAG: hypothetical protein QM733_24835 [Ilumatobacteraceae bacterium]
MGFDFVNSLVSPFGITGVLAYSQYDFLSFSQLALIFGLWGMTFMITWFGSMITWCADNAARPMVYGKGLLIYGAIWTAVVVYGGLRLAMPLKTNSVRIAAMHTHDKDREGQLLWKYVAEKDLGAFTAGTNADLSRLIDATRTEGASGAHRSLVRSVPQDPAFWSGWKAGRRHLLGRRFSQSIYTAWPAACGYIPQPRIGLAGDRSIAFHRGRLPGHREWLLGRSGRS